MSNCDDAVKFGDQITNAPQNRYKHNGTFLLTSFGYQSNCHNDKIKMQLNCFVMKMERVRKHCKEFQQQCRLQQNDLI